MGACTVGTAGDGAQCCREARTEVCGVVVVVDGGGDNAAGWVSNLKLKNKRVLFVELSSWELLPKYLSPPTNFISVEVKSCYSSKHVP